ADRDRILDSALGTCPNRSGAFLSDSFRRRSNVLCPAVAGGRLRLWTLYWLRSDCFVRAAVVAESRAVGTNSLAIHDRAPRPMARCNFDQGRHFRRAGFDSIFAPRFKRASLRQVMQSRN